MGAKDKKKGTEAKKARKVSFPRQQIALNYVSGVANRANGKKIVQ